MSDFLPRWKAVCLKLGLTLAILAGGLLLVNLDAGPLNRSGVTLALGGGLALLLFVPLMARALQSLEPEGPPLVPRSERRPYVTLFLVSFASLFLEILLIRYCASQIRIFAFFKNIPLIASFLGLGLGLCLGRGGSRNVFAFVLWLFPVSVFLSVGTYIGEVILSVSASAASSEHILGDVAIAEPPLFLQVASQLIVGAFCVGILLVLMALFSELGKVLARAFEPLPRLPSYTVNIVGSLCGIFAFSALSLLETPPWVWFTVGLLPLLWWMDSRRQTFQFVLVALATILTTVPSRGETTWSRYQKLVGYTLELPKKDGGFAPAYMVHVSEAFYQAVLDLSPEAVAEYQSNPGPHYDAAFDSLPIGAEVLVVGAGSGNDVAAALRAGAVRVDAVDIDPAIIRIGEARHPERPYGDDRVRVIVADARKAMRGLPPGSYDAVVFGLLDSHTQLGTSSLRLDNYVFTTESFDVAARLLRPGGQLIVTAVIFRPWLGSRITQLLENACGSPVSVQSFSPAASFRCSVVAAPGKGTPGVSETLPSDDWPFLYLPRRGVPFGYLFVVGAMALSSVVFLRKQGLGLRGFGRYHWHLFSLGAAFLLMETYAINRLALLFGTTWLVSATTIGLVLFLIVLANVTVLAAPTVRYRWAYGGLLLTLFLSFSLSPEFALGSPLPVQLAYGIAVLSPVYFAGLIFARSFSFSAVAGTALGANVFGSAVGGWLEYSTMALGIRAMVPLAGALYLASALFLRVPSEERKSS